MPIPPFRDDLWLPEGHHISTWEEIADIFSGEPGSKRNEVFKNLIRWRDMVRNKGVTGLLTLNGSFISAVPNPGDFDAFFVIDEEKAAMLELDPDAMQLMNHTFCEQNYGGDIFIFSEIAVREFPTMCRTDGFDTDKKTHRTKGVIEVRI